jgi:hypothetical protein
MACSRNQVPSLSPMVTIGRRRILSRAISRKACSAECSNAASERSDVKIGVLL